jgi:HEAT repeat protein
MVRQLIAVGLIAFALLAFAAGPVMADRLGGAYRGPYQDNITEKEIPETGTSDTGGSDAPAPDSGDSGGGDSGGGDAPTGDGTSGGGSGGDEGGGDEGGGDEGGGDGGAAPPPSATPGSGGDDGGGDGGGDTPISPGGDTTGPSGSIGPNPLSGRTSGKTAVEDVFAYWPFWFEHNKEWVLAEILRSRAEGMGVSPGSSVWYFAGGQEGEKRVPISGETKKDVILPLLIEATTHGNPWIRDAAVIALGKLGLPEVVDPLKERARRDKDYDIRQDALLALGLSGQKEAMDPLLQALGVDRLRAYAALGLALLGREEALPVLLKEYKEQQRARDKETAACLAVAIGQLGDEKAVGALAAPLKSTRGDNHLKVYICHALGKIGGDEAKKWVLRALSSRDQGVQAAAVLALSRWEDKTVINELRGRDGLKSGNRMATLFSLISLGKIAQGLDLKDPKRKMIGIDVIEWATKPMKDKYRAMYGALAMALMGDESSNQFFVEMLEDDNRRKFSSENHSAIALSAGLLQIETVARDLREIVARKTYEADYRGYAAFALGVMGDTKSKELIRDALQESRQKHELLRSGAWALGMLGGPSDIDLLIDVIEREGPGLHAARGAAALAIGMVGDATSVEKIIEAYQKGSDIPTKAFLLAGLGCLVDASTAPRIPQLFGNVHYRREYPVVRQVMSIL